MGDNENPIEAGQFLGEDGAFQTNWRDHAFPGDEGEALRSNPTLTNIKDVRAMARQVVAGESTIGKLSGGRDFAILPNEQSTEDERTAFHTKCGRPPSAEGYDFDKVEMPAGEKKDDKFITKMSTALFGAGASKGVGDAAMKAYMEYSAELKQAMDTEDRLANTEANRQLHTLLGSGYDTKMASAKVAIEALARPIDNDFAETLLAEIPYDVHAAQFFAKIGEMVSEDPGLKDSTAQTGLTPGDAMTKINEIMKNPYYITDSPKDKPVNTQYHEELVLKVNRLFEIKKA